MSTALLVTLTVVEVVALVAVLAVFVILITRRLRSIATALGRLSGSGMGGVLREIQGDVCLVGAGTAILNTKLNAIASMLPAMAAKAESMADQQTAWHQASDQQASDQQTSGQQASWQQTAGQQTQAGSTAAQDPLIGRQS